LSLSGLIAIWQSPSFVQALPSSNWHPRPD
jgi:hypothetical protein